MRNARGVFLFPRTASGTGKQEVHWLTASRPERQGSATRHEGRPKNLARSWAEGPPHRTTSIAAERGPSRFPAEFRKRESGECPRGPAGSRVSGSADSGG